MGGGKGAVGLSDSRAVSHTVGQPVGQAVPQSGETVIEIVRISGGQPTPAYSTTLYVNNMIDAYGTWSNFNKIFVFLSQQGLLRILRHS